MATSLNIAEFLECSICMDTYTNPKQLSCHHQYCKDCLDQILQFNRDGSASITCPNRCATKTIISENATTDSLGIMYTFKDIVEKFKLTKANAEVPTSICYYTTNCKKYVSTYCCGILLCRSCATQHHNTQKPHDGKNDVIVDRKGGLKVLCKEHLTPCTHQCSDNDFLCLYCLNRKHKKHVKYTIEEQVTKVKKALTNDSQEAENLKTFVEVTDEDIIEGRKKLDEALRKRKISCLSSYLDILDKEGEFIKKQYEDISKAHKRQYPLAYEKVYYDEKLSKSDILLTIENSVILDELSRSGVRHSTLRNVTVSLSEGGDSAHPLGDLQVWFGDKVLFSNPPTSTFIGNIGDEIDNFKNTLSKLKEDLKILLPQLNLTDDCSRGSIGNLSEEQKQIQRGCLEQLQQKGECYVEYLTRSKENDKLILLLMERTEIVKMKFGYYQSTPFLVAAEVNNIALMKVLLQYGADYEDRDASGDTAIHVAVRQNNIECVEWLLQCQPASIDIKNDYGNTPLHVAACFGCLPSLQCLLNYGAGVNLKNGNSKTPLQLAQRKGEHACVEELKKWSGEHVR